MMKYLLVMLVLVIAYNIWRKQRRMDAPPPPRRPSSAPRIPQQMVPCAHCGLMLPQSDALTQDGQHYCCADHQRRGPA